MYDWYLKPLSTYYYYKLAFEPLHVQLSPLDGMVTIVNRRLQAEKDLEVNIRVFDNQMKLLWEKKAPGEIGSNTYKNVFSIPSVDKLTPLYFVKLSLTQKDKVVSENFYWLNSGKPSNWRDLNTLPMVRLQMEKQIEDKGGKSIVHVKIRNPTDQLAFFIHLAITKGYNGEEVLPIFWDDNYFSLLPNETREITATFDAKELDGAEPVVEAGGWNIITDYKCANLTTSKTKVAIGEKFVITAGITDTFIDGSKVTLMIDNKPYSTRWAWNRGDKSYDIKFNVTMKGVGKHTLNIGGKNLIVQVE